MGKRWVLLTVAAVFVGAATGTAVATIQPVDAQPTKDTRSSESGSKGHVSRPAMSMGPRIADVPAAFKVAHDPFGFSVAVPKGAVRKKVYGGAEASVDYSTPSETVRVTREANGVETLPPTTHAAAVDTELQIKGVYKDSYSQREMSDNRVLGVSGTRWVYDIRKKKSVERYSTQLFVDKAGQLWYVRVIYGASHAASGAKDMETVMSHFRVDRAV